MTRMQKDAVRWVGWRGKLRHGILWVTGSGVLSIAGVAATWHFVDRTWARPYVASVASDVYESKHAGADITLKRLSSADSAQCATLMYIKHLTQAMASDSQRKRAETALREERTHWDLPR